MPDFLPAVCYRDDLVSVPACAWLARRLTPPEVLADARDPGDEGDVGRVRRVVAGLVVVGRAGTALPLAAAWRGLA